MKGSRKGREMQLLSDKCRDARENGEAWLTYRGRRLRIVPMPEGWRKEEVASGPSVEAFVRGRGRICLTRVHRSDTGRIRADGGSWSVRYVDDRDVMALVAESHPRTQ